MFPNCLHYNQICRICFASSDELIQIFNYEDGSIVKILMSLAMISVNIKKNSFFILKKLKK